MPMFVNTHGTVITIFVLLHPVFAFTKLSFLSPNASILDTSSYQYINTSTPQTTMSDNSNNSNRTGSSVYSARRSKNTAIEPSYPVTGYVSSYSEPIAFTYPDFRKTISDDVSTIKYPYITTSESTSHHILHRHHKPQQVTRLYLQPVRRTPGNFFSSEDSYDNSIEKDFIPLTPLWSKGNQRWSTSPNYQINQFANPSKSSNTFPSGFSGLSSSGFSFTAGAPSAIDTIHETTAHHHIPVITELHHTKHAQSKLDLKKLGILALVKIGLAKLKIFGLLKVLFFILLKFKLILMLIFVKFLLFLKALKLIKALLLPFLLLSLLPLLLLLLPLLLYLALPLLGLPVPVMVPSRYQHGRIGILDHISTQNTDILLEIMDQLLNSERCVERIACQLATKKQAKLFYPVLSW